ncbi:hypothetical protein MMC12_001541 [Toensbergia leucococca]|nr:hypothetical protein [Toensbergia leucococca]
MNSILLQERQSSSPPLHAPYPPTTSSLGGVPTTSLDVPITAVFLLLYLLGAISHMTIFQLNMRRDRKFIISGMMFGFCCMRVVTCIMRIVWATRPENVSIAIAAEIFVAVGVVIAFVVNMNFAQRILRASHPRSFWHPVVSASFVACYALIVVSIFMLVFCTVQSFYTLNNNTKRIDRDVQLYGQTYFAIISFMPIPLVIGGIILPHKVEQFGSGRFRTKIGILLAATTLLCLGASFRVGTNYITPRPANNPAWYQSKACFYVFNFTVEILVIWLYIIVRVDHRFFVPRGASRPGDYLAGRGHPVKDVEKGERTMVTRIMSEEEVFDDEPKSLEKGSEGSESSPSPHTDSPTERI